MRASHFLLCLILASDVGLAQNQPENLKMPGPDAQNLMLGTFKLEGNRLEIGDGKTWRRVLERVH